MFYSDKSKWNTLFESKESTEIAKMLRTNEAKILRIGNDTSDEREMNHMHEIFVESEVILHINDKLLCMMNNEWFLRTFKDGVIAYYIIDKGEEAKIEKTYDRSNIECIAMKATENGMVINLMTPSMVKKSTSGILTLEELFLDDEKVKISNRSAENELTLEELKAMEPGIVFAHGVIENSPDGLYMSNSNIGKKLIWVAKRGGIHDWAIYVHWEELGIAHVLAEGDKVSKYNVRKIVKCNDEALKWYRQ